MSAKGLPLPSLERFVLIGSASDGVVIRQENGRFIAIPVAQVPLLIMQLRAAVADVGALARAP